MSNKCTIVTPSPEEEDDPFDDGLDNNSYLWMITDSSIKREYDETVSAPPQEAECIKKPRLESERELRVLPLDSEVVDLTWADDASVEDGSQIDSITSGSCARRTLNFDSPVGSDSGSVSNSSYEIKVKVEPDDDIQSVVETELQEDDEKEELSENCDNIECDNSDDASEASDNSTGSNTLMPHTRIYKGKKSIYTRSPWVEVETSSELDGKVKKKLLWNTLGRLRECDGIQFSWNASAPVAFSQPMGRAYFDEFTLSGATYKVGDFVQLSNSNAASVLVRIVSAFQATKSFVGSGSEYKKLGYPSVTEVQQRGHPYIEVKEVGDTQVRLPDWLLDDQLSLKKSKKPSKRVPGLTADVFTCHSDTIRETFAATEYINGTDPVLFVFKDHERRTKQLESDRSDDLDVPLQLNEYDSDDSDAFDEESMQFLENENSSSRSKVKSRSASVSRKACHRSDALELIRGCGRKEEKYSSIPLQLFLSSKPSEEASSLFNTAASEAECEKKLEDAQLLLMHTNKCDLQVINMLKAVRVSVTSLQKLVQFNPKHDGTFDSTFMRQFGYKDKRNPQDEVCQAVTDTRFRSDTAFIAPCGFGKSYCFVACAYKTRGITLVVEPLRALIENQVKTLTTMFKKCPNSNMQVAQLLTVDDSIRQQKFSAHDMLQQLCNEPFDANKSLVLFSTPEHVVQDYNASLLAELSRFKKLRNVIIDEFDIISETGQHFRPQYQFLIPTLRSNCANAKFLFLSATATEPMLKQILINNHIRPTERPSFYHTERPLVDNHVHLVESKVSDLQCQRRILEILQCYQERHNETAQAVCFCLTPNICNTYMQFFRSQGVKCAIFISSDNSEAQKDQVGRIYQSKSEREKVVEQFTKNKIHVIFATTSLGRGVHLGTNVRFAFFPYPPSSLSNYIQQSGRVGRDNKRAYVYLFYRNEDQSMNRQILCRNNGRSAYIDQCLDEVKEYAFNGRKCRYQLLATKTSILLDRNRDISCSEDALCDICQYASKSVYNPLFCRRTHASSYIRQGITEPLLDVIERTIKALEKSTLRVISPAKLRSQFFDATKSAIAATSNTDQKLLYSLLIVPTDALLKEPKVLNGKASASEMYLLHVLVRYLAGCKTSLGMYDLVPKLKELRQSFSGNNETVCVQYPSRNTIPVEPNAAVTTYDVPDQFFDVEMPDNDVEGSSYLLSLPFIVKYELERHCNNNNTVHDAASEQLIKELRDKCRAEGNVAACKLIHDRFPQVEGSSAIYSHEANSHSHFFYKASLQNDKVLKLLPPDVAFSKRIYRVFGSERFLEVAVRDKIDRRMAAEFLQNSLHICGRTWRCLWVKKDTQPMLFVFFAESGTGIDKEQEYTIEQVQRFCIPKHLNPDLSIAKYSKRMKLCFSTTTETFKLPQNSVHVLPDFSMKDFDELDGCGLLSRGALNKIWEYYCINMSNANNASNFSLSCPYSGFQGRLGGFKGTWIVDESIGSMDDVVVHCRSSQLKYNTPSVCLFSDPTQTNNNISRDGRQSASVLSELQRDQLYETIEINSWDNNVDTQLNTRIVQLLEHHGVPFSFFEQYCYDPMRKELELLSRGRSSNDEDSTVSGGRRTNQDYRGSVWVSLLKKRNSNMSKKGDTGTTPENKDSRLVFQMATNGRIPEYEPEFLRRRKRLTRKLYSSIRDKAHYPIENSCMLRMYADHTLLLNEGEAFLALNINSIPTEIVCVRSPSYFAGDLRKLKVVSIGELAERASRNKMPKRLPSVLCRNEKERVDFFRTARNCLILCNKGRSEADKMSGGDYDGDMPWICWNDELIKWLNDTNIQPENTSTVTAETARIETENFWQSSTSRYLVYNFKFMQQNSLLGSISETLDCCIDKFGFSDERTNEYGRAAFWQVDVPYNKYEIRHGVKETTTLGRTSEFKWPHWKNRKSEQSYLSKTTLGRLYTILNDAIESMGRNEKETTGAGKNTLEVPEAIELLVKEFERENSEKCLSTRKKVRDAVEVYLSRRKSYANEDLKVNGGTYQTSGASDKDSSLFGRCASYASARREFIFGSSGVYKLHIAAVLYKECFVLETRVDDPKRYSLELAWHLAKFELFVILSDPSAYCVNQETEQDVLDSTPFSTTRRILLRRSL